MAPKIDREFQQECVILYEGGWNVAQVARWLDREPSTVRYQLLNAGVELRGYTHTRNRLSHAEMEKTVTLYENGLTMRAIGKELGIHPSTVGARLRRAGVQRRTRHETMKLIRANTPMEAKRAQGYRSAELRGYYVLSEFELHHARKLYVEEKMSLREVARTMNLPGSPCTIARRLGVHFRRRGWPLRSYSEARKIIIQRRKQREAA